MSRIMFEQLSGDTVAYPSWHIKSSITTIKIQKMLYQNSPINTLHINSHMIESNIEVVMLFSYTVSFCFVFCYAIVLAFCVS